MVGAWTWNINHAGDLRAARRKAQSLRTTSDGEVRHLQARGTARLVNFLRDQLSGDSGSRSVGAVGRDLAGSLREDSSRLPIAVWVTTVVVVVFGSRELLLHQIPAVGQMAPFPHGPGSLLREFLSG